MTKLEANGVVAGARIGGVACVVALAMIVLPAPAQASTGDQQSGETFVVSYVEAPVQAAAPLRSALSAYSAFLKTGANKPDVEVLHEIGRPNRLAVIERWPSGASATASDEAATRLHALVDDAVEAPLDRRINHADGNLLTARRPAPFNMLMHVDVVPTGAGLAAHALEDQRTAVMGTPGALGFEMAVQADRPNHFAIHEAWASRAAYESYAASPAARQLRQQLSTVKGALFDDRFFTPLEVAGR